MTPPAGTTYGQGAPDVHAGDGPQHDYALVGGGLQNGLIALALLEAQPAARLALVERSTSLGGNHTWCFHAGDLPEAARTLVDPLIAHRWPGYEVIFPEHRRVLESPYAAITAQRFDAVVRERLARSERVSLFLGCEAKAVSEREVQLADGRRLRARVVIDARGPEQGAIDARRCGYQKFVGLELQLRRPHGRTLPLLMDATVEQRDGYRFLYVLPLAPDRLLVEDTRISDTPRLDRDAVAADAAAYARAQGWDTDRIERQESGVLPLPWSGQPRPPDRGPLLGGYQGGWFHPVTGYSFPLALRLALLVAQEPGERLFGARLAELAAAERTQRTLCHWLNRMFFQWFPPEQRYQTLQRFYRLPEPTIRRFYAMRLRAGDRARILLGRPPRGLSLSRVLGLRSAAG